ncbi:hypothetical protein GCM10008022_18970 [Paenibacillus hunanensis]|nr:hypothetical protein GCM10008022_18970 [Paenibacillus hunanensis]
MKARERYRWLDRIVPLLNTIHSKKLHGWSIPVSKLFILVMCRYRLSWWRLVCGVWKGSRWKAF